MQILEQLETFLYAALLFAALTGVGLTLDSKAFASIWQSSVLAEKSPSRALVLGLFGLYFFLPLVAGLIIKVMAAPPAVATGLMMIAIMPGGPASAVYAMVMKGFTGLNVTMTVVSTAIAPLAVPMMYYLAVAGSHEGTAVKVSFLHLILTSVMVAFPLLFGVWLSYRLPDMKDKIEERLAPCVMFAIVIIFVSKAGHAITQERVVCAAMLSLAALSGGFAIGFLGNIGFKNSMSLALELVLRDIPLVMSIVQNSFDDQTFRRDVQDTAIVIGMTAHFVCLSCVGVHFLLQHLGLQAESKMEAKTLDEPPC